MARQTIQNANASLYLDGNAGYLTVPITPAPTGFSFGMWIKPGKRTTASSTIYMSSNSASFTDGFILFRGVGRGDIDFLAYNSTNSGGTLRTGQVSDGAWHHIAVTYLPSGSCSIYQNGALVQTITASNSMATGTTSIYVGRRSYTAAFAGLNASQLVWHNTTTPWTAAQVLALYQQGTVPTGATAVYPLSEGAGTVAYDTSGNGNNGTITSGTWSRETPSKTRKGVNGNMVYNGDFEIAPVVNVATTTAARWIDGTAAGSTTNNIFGWGVVTKTGTAEAIFDSTSPSSGTESIKVSTTATASKIEVGSNGIDTAANNRISCISVLPSTSYTLTFRMKTQLNSGTATGGARVGVNTFTGAGTYVDTPVLTTAIKTTTDWTTYTSTFTTSATVRLLAVYLIIDGSGGTATLIMDAWFADITLTPTTPTTRTAATGRSTVSSRTAA